MVGDIFKALFGGGRNVITDTAGFFRTSREGQARRDHQLTGGAQAQFGREFQSENRTNWFDRLIDGLNRIPRPLMAFGIIGMFVSAMVDPVWFASRMTGIALVPEPLWWLLSAIIAFYFGGRHQAKVQTFDMQKQINGVKAVVETRKIIDDVQDTGAEIERVNIAAGDIEADLSTREENAVISEWMNKHGDLR